MNIQPICFPYVCAEENVCVNDKFRDWDDLQGWSWTDEIPLPTFARRLQSWLFFGLVSFYLDCEVPHDRLLEGGPDGRQIINFTGQDNLLQPLLEKASSLFSKEQVSDAVPERQSRFQQGLRAAMSFMDLVVIPYLNGIDDGTVTDVWSSEPHAVIFGIDILIDILLEQVETFQAVSRLFSRYTYRRSSLAAEVRVIRESVYRGGRCKSLAGRLRPLSKTWHTIILLPHTGVVENHEPCTTLHCKLNDVEEKTYKPQHTDSCSGCAFLHSNPQDLVAAISKDKIPLIHCSLDGKQRLTIKVVEGDLSFRYTAISHVWSGGLGNSENSLPQCQISRLREIISDLPDMQVMNIQHIGEAEDDGLSEKLMRLIESALNVLRSRKTVYFWLDTLCIPQDKEYRQRAIETMAQIYAGAETVLVLDPHMQQLQDMQVTDHIFVLHLVVSPWMSRSWPLQEGAVASNLAVRLRNRAVFLTRDQQKRLLRVSLQLTDCLFENRLVRNPTYISVWNALACRGTTKREDLDGIFAALLNLDPGKLLELPRIDRMKAIISTQRLIPLTLLCISREKGEGTDGSWIPRFPDTRSALVRLNDFHGNLFTKEDGFLLSVSADSSTFGILVHDVTIPQGDFVIKDSYDETCYKIFVDMGALHVGSSAPPGSLFLFTFDRVTGSPRYRGSHFEILSEEDTTTKLKYRASCCWAYSGARNPGDQVLVGDRFTKLCNASHRVLLVEDVANWPKPDWFRLQMFPFIGIVDTHFEKWTAAFYPSFVLTSVLGFMPILSSLDIETLSTVGKYVIPGWWCLARAMYSLVERAFWERWLAQCVQQRWAATFHNNEAARDLLLARSPTLSFALWTYTPIFLMAFGSLAYSWANPAYRMALIWVAVTLFAEPLVCLGFTTIMDLKQSFERSHLIDPFPFRGGIAALLCSAGAIPFLLLMAKDIFLTGPWRMEGLELRAFEVSLIFCIVSCFGCCLWATGLPSVLYLMYQGKIPSTERLALQHLGTKKNKAD